MTTMTFARPLTSDEVRERDAQRRLEARHRKIKVELRHLPYCRVCGGATVQVENEPELECVCARLKAEAEARVQEILNRRRRERAEEHLVDVIAP